MNERMKNENEWKNEKWNEMKNEMKWTTSQPANQSVNCYPSIDLFSYNGSYISLGWLAM